ncbi:LOW QUALITY PROTEIN: hypothetical protein CRUP_023636 [Coryphaenoides rupestris]|nr:LOW QUALITY PROTEIN: hypothetical protein CRUP_023636 [Coryphaenoides rupestris]
MVQTKHREQHLLNFMSFWKACLNSSLNTITGLMRELRYPSQVNTSNSSGSNQHSLQMAITRVPTKKGSQHTMNAPRMMPSVLVAFRSRAAHSRFLSSTLSASFTFTLLVKRGDAPPGAEPECRCASWMEAELMEQREEPADVWISCAVVKRLARPAGVFRMRERAAT